MFAVMLSAYAGTMSFHEDGRGMYWESNYHVVTHCVEDTREQAEAELARVFPFPTKWIRHAWIAPYETRFQ
jgi:hypothetical protein